MHTSGHIMVPHLLERTGTFYYNRRVPKHAVDAYGATVRIKLSHDREEASELAKALSAKLDQAWSSGSLKRVVDVKALLEAVRPRPVLLTDWVAEYIELKGIDPTPPKVAVDTLVSIVGHKEALAFTVEELQQGAAMALAGSSRLALLFPVLAETGCRLGEVVGLRLQDIDLKQELIRITPHSARSLKTRGSERELPLVGVGHCCATQA
jgi:integrase